MNLSKFKEKHFKLIDFIGDKLDKVNIFRIAIVGAIFFTCIIFFQKCQIENKDNTIKDNEETIRAISDTVTKWKDENGRKHLKITALTNSNTNNILKLSSNKEDINHLQDIIKEYQSALKKSGSSVTVSKPVLNFESVLKTEKKNAEKILDSSVIEQSIKDEWVDVHFGFTKDSTWLKFKTFDKVSILNKFERKNIFSKYILNTELIHENPNVEYEYIRGWQNNSVPNDRWILGPTLSTGFDQNLKFTWIIGVGITYKVVAF